MKRKCDQLRVLIVLPDAALGGAHTMNFRLASSLNDRGWNVDVAFLFDRIPQDHYTIIYPTVRQHLLGRPDIYGRIRIVPRLARLVRNYDVILAGLDLAATNYSYLVSLITRKPILVWMHTAFSEQMRRLSWLDRIISLFVYRRIQCIVFPSSGSKSSLKHALGQKPYMAQWTIVQNYLPSRATSCGPSVHFPSKLFDKPVVINVGRLANEKALDRLIRIHARIRRTGVEHHLLLLGEGSERTMLEELAAKEGVSETVFMPGHVSDPAPWLRRSTVFALCSRYEGLPLALLEAMREGLPIVSMDCPAGPREILDGGSVGILTPDGDEASLEIALEKLLLDAAARSHYAKQALLRAKYYDEDHVLPLWETLLGSLARPQTGNAVPE